MRGYRKRIDIRILVYTIVIGVLLSKVRKYCRMEQQVKELRRDKEFLKNCANSLKQEVEIQKETTLKLAVQRHDMRHSANLIMACVEKKDYESIRGILLQFNRQLEEVVQKKYCDNVIMDGVLSSCDNMAEMQNVKYLCHVVMPDNLGFDERQQSGRR